MLCRYKDFTMARWPPGRAERVGISLLEILDQTLDEAAVRRWCEDRV